MERRLRQEVKVMTRKEIIVRAIAKELSWVQAADICGITARQMRRLKRRYERYGYDGLGDGRSGKPRRKRIALETIERLCELRRTQYADFSVQHFWEKATEVHQLEISYTWAKLALQAAGLAEKSPGRGKYRRRRERRPVCGMMLHLDGSTHEWLVGQPLQDLIVLQDDADSRIHYAQFVPQEGTLSTFAALKHVLQQAGRFCELYTDRGSHFCHTPLAGQAATTAHQGQVSRALKALGIRQILAYSPQARGRSERTFQTIQGRLPQELRAAGITTYTAANAYLARVFVPDFNRRFTVAPTQAGTAFVPVIGVDLDLLLSIHHERTVNNDSTVRFDSLSLQLPRRPDRAHYVRCPVLVHEFPEGTLGISYQGRLLARYSRDGQLLPTLAPPRGRPGRKTQRTGTTQSLSPLPLMALGAAGRVGSRPAARRPGLPRPTAPHHRRRAPRRGASRPAPEVSTTLVGAAAHSVDGDTTTPQQPTTYATLNHPAIHNVDTRFGQRPPSARRAANTTLNKNARRTRRK
jgi:transposase